MKLTFEAEVFKEGDDFVAHATAFDVSSCGKSPDEAVESLLEAVVLFFETTQDIGTFEQVLAESGYTLRGDEWSPENVIPAFLFNAESSRRAACLEF